MARVTIENCLKKVNGHFELVLLAGERAKQISLGRKTGIIKKGVKTHVTALREIEEEAVSIDVLRSNLIDRINNNVEVNDSLSDDNDELIEELQSSEFITGEIEEIDDPESLGITDSTINFDVDFDETELEDVTTEDK